MYVVDYDYGKVTLNGDFALGNLTGPLTAKYRYQDMGLVRDVKINGQITFTKPLTHNYDPTNTIVGSALVIGDMKARYTRLFVQGTWSSEWSDEPVGESLYQLIITILFTPLMSRTRAVFKSAGHWYSQATRHFESLVRFQVL